MEAVGDALLSAAIGLLFDKLASTDLLDFARQQWVYSDLKKWEIELSNIREELNDAEDKQITDHSVKEWLGNLKDLAYDMEDILDESPTKLCNGNSRPKKLIIKAGRARYASSSPLVLAFSILMRLCVILTLRSKVLEITRRLRDISAQKSELRLEKVAAITNSARGRPVTASLGYEPQVYGRGTEKEIIIGMLLRNEPTKTNFSVVSIVATGGMGKTTLARLVYDDDKTVTKHLIKKPGLCSPFWVGAQGSKILVTTRNNNVANKMRGHKILHELKQLPYDDCLKIFQTHAFEHMNIDEHPNLESIGRRIVEKCGGFALSGKSPWWPFAL
ncbi:Disease resistance protein RGA2 [Vitis vinifera]|uniref:Disease resistance protein RGA2 n=1 Tax=Vitis vinifera TaxID=29760 RepID=A0A438FRU7_VITVI|nr:Disease resistance protein RGA2 [Vitis vinifera]